MLERARCQKMPSAAAPRRAVVSRQRRYQQPLFCLLAWIGMVTANPLLFAQVTANKDASIWQLGQTDTGLKESELQHRLVSADSASGGAQADEFSFVAGNGTEVQLVRPLEPSRVIPEWSVSLPVKANWRGVRLSVRVVLPHSFDPLTGKRLTTLLSGTATTSLSGWETLGVGSSATSISESLQQAIWVLRKKYGSEVSDRDAYIDQLVLNVYGGKGQHAIQIGTPRTSGSVGLDTRSSDFREQSPLYRDLALRQVSFQENDEREVARVRRDGTVLELNDQPFLARLIQHNGESFAFLKSLGFNTIQLATTATDVQVLEAEQADVWLVCPPPTDWQTPLMAVRSERIIAWMLGDGLGEQQSRNVAERIREVKTMDPRAQRPVAVGANGKLGRLCTDRRYSWSSAN